MHVAAVAPALDSSAARKAAGVRPIVHRAPGPQVIALMPAAGLAVIDDDPNRFSARGVLVALRERAVRRERVRNDTLREALREGALPLDQAGD